MKTTMKTNHALCRLISGLLLLAAGTAPTHAVLISLVNPDFDTTPQGWTSNYYEASGAGITPNTAPNVLDIINFPSGTSQATPDYAYQDTTHPITAGETYTLSFYAGVRTTVGTANSINVDAGLRSQGGTSDLARFDVIGAIAPVGSMQQYILNWTVPSSGAFLGQNLEVYFQGYTSSPDGSYFHQISIDTVNLSFTAAPEPTSAALLLGSGAMLLLRRRRASAL